MLCPTALQYFCAWDTSKYWPRGAGLWHYGMTSQQAIFQIYGNMPSWSGPNGLIQSPIRIWYRPFLKLGAFPESIRALAYLVGFFVPRFPSTPQVLLRIPCFLMASGHPALVISRLCADSCVSCWPFLSWLRAIPNLLIALLQHVTVLPRTFPHLTGYLTAFSIGMRNWWFSGRSWSFSLRSPKEASSQ